MINSDFFVKFEGLYTKTVSKFNELFNNPLFIIDVDEDCLDEHILRILINYEETHSEYKLMEVTACDKNAIKTKDDLVINMQGITRWFQALNNHQYMEISELKSDVSNLLCPSCGNPLVLRPGIKNKYASFLGCSRYPTCKETVQL